MAIKKLQNNFTTPEQSKRLLELGVPRWSADEYRDRKGRRYNLDGISDVELFFQNFPDYLPCWSAGRLMEIYGICMGVEGFFYCKGYFINEAIRRIEGSVKDNLIDFSKLEE